MRIVLHAGLHKSGTTTVQEAWRASLSGAGPVRYPTRKRGGPPGHHYLFRPLLATPPHHRSRQRSVPGGGPRGRLLATVSRAAADGADTLVLSSEALDRLTTEDVPALVEALGSHEVTALVTVTPPAHRWCAGWQELVKHGSASYPRDAPDEVLTFASLHVRRLEELVLALPAVRRVVRLVRPSPAEEDLAASLSKLMGLPRPLGATGPPRNTSLGTDVEVLRRLNAAGLASGLSPRSRQLLDELRGEGFRVESKPSLASRYAYPPEFQVAARAELDFLSAPGSVEVADPHELLQAWEHWEPPTWYRAISQQEAVIPGLGPVDQSSASRRRSQSPSADQSTT